MALNKTHYANAIKNTTFLKCSLRVLLKQKSTINKSYKQYRNSFYLKKAIHHLKIIVISELTKHKLLKIYATLTVKVLFNQKNNFKFYLSKH
ncbi:hypothetical protein OD90_2237 [Dokdonia sp. Hel_I_53]|nr:hypothetical protein OD90_2237 [Dokdonia sp. Hel_I_53]